MLQPEGNTSSLLAFGEQVKALKTRTNGNRASRKPNFLAWLERLPFLIVHSLSHRGSLTIIIYRVAEPIAVVSLLTFSNYILSGAAPFGDSMFVFQSTGVIIYYLFFHTTIRLRNLDDYQLLPRVSKIDEALARALSEFIIKICIYLFLSAIFFAIGSHQWYPSSPLTCLHALASIVIVSTVIGVINANIIAFFPPWKYTFIILMRAALLISAVANVMDRVPRPFRMFTVWNPLSHFIAWFRSGWYPNYPTAMLDQGYLLKFALVCVFFAFMFEGGTRPIRDIR